MALGVLVRDMGGWWPWQVTWCPWSSLPAWAVLCCCWCKRAELKDCDSGVKISQCIPPGLNRVEAKQECMIPWISFVFFFPVQVVEVVLQFCLCQSGIQSWTRLQGMIVKSFFSYFCFKSSWMISLVCQCNLSAKEAFVHELAQPLPW